MAVLRALLAVCAVLSLGGCWRVYESSVSSSSDGRATMRDMDNAIDSTTLQQAQVALSNQTWLYQNPSGRDVHYSTSDGRDFLWRAEAQQIAVGEWRVEIGINHPKGNEVAKICLRYPSEARHPTGGGGPGSQWHCRPAGLVLFFVKERRAGDVLGLANRTQVPYVRVAFDGATISQLQSRIGR
ncbi:MAG: hypothetical protein FJX11_16590 [Alphaproteobacteria bacterium]|nr:hypothetical protein [Alphaproteobacteria bacterium]